MGPSRRVRSGRLTSALLLVCATPSFAACNDTTAEAAQSSEATRSEASGVAARDDAAERARVEQMNREYPLHGVVTGVQLSVRQTPSPDALVLGWLRIGARLRAKREPTRTATCRSGWYAIHPRGWVCAGQGVTVGTEAQPPGPDERAFQDDALPYAYYFVKDPFAAEYHRVPSRDEQRATLAFGEAYAAAIEDSVQHAERLWNGEIPGAPTRPAVLRRFLDRGFFVAGVATETRAARRFVKTVRNTVVKEAHLEPREAPQFHGVELGPARTLPIAFALRTARPLIRRNRADGTVRFIDDREAPLLERQSILEQWEGRERVGDDVLHKITNERYLRSWFVGVAERIQAPRGTRDDEPWVHVDLSEQTLVLYRGATPVYATLVSTGLDGHNTPVGTFTLRKKFVSDTMADLGPDAGDDRYRIDDVPWTQYFVGSIALHGTFWHQGFGIQRSHGCVNLAPIDARYIFERTWPEVPDGWHGVSTEGAPSHTSKVVITE